MSLGRRVLIPFNFLSIIDFALLGKMAEPFSVAVGALSLIGVMKEIKEIGSACATFFGDIKHAKGHLQDLKDEANMLYIVLKSIANDMEQISYLSPEESSPAMWYLTVALDDYKKAVVSVRASVDELEKRTPNEADPSVKARFRFVRAKERIERYRESIKSHIQLLGIQQHNFHELVIDVLFHATSSLIQQGRSSIQ